jgi:hypothetical protein
VPRRGADSRVPSLPWVPLFRCRVVMSDRLARGDDLAVERLQRGDVDLRERGAGVDGGAQHLEWDTGADGQGGLLQALAGFVAERVGPVSRSPSLRRVRKPRGASSKSACPAAFSQKAPVPGHPTIRSEPDSNSPRMIFMPRTAGAAVETAALSPKEQPRAPRPHGWRAAPTDERRSYASLPAVLPHSGESEPVGSATTALPFASRGARHLARAARC